MSRSNQTLISYYLPQYYEIEDNNNWWGEGFTEWVAVKSYRSESNVDKPGVLGFYNLLDPRIIELQYNVAKTAGIDAFCVWHYWFDDDDTIMEKPFQNLLASSCDVKFCFAWANHTWFNKKKGVLLKEQVYDFDREKHFNFLLDYFLDDRYLKIDNKPVLTIFDPLAIPDLTSFLTEYENLAIKAGFDGIVFIGENCSSQDREKYGLNYSIESRNVLKNRSLYQYARDAFIYSLQRLGIHRTRTYDYSTLIHKLNDKCKRDNKSVPVIFPRWDSSIRHGQGGWKFVGANPSTFEEHVKNVYESSQNHSILLVKSWNEWAEGNYMEPSEQYNDEYLVRLKKYFG